MIVADGKPDDLAWDSPAGNGTAVGAEFWVSGQRTVYGFRFAVPLQAEASALTYQIGGMAFQIALPGQGQPPRIAYASCNGFSDPKLMKSVDDKNHMWKVMAARHAVTPINLLLMGGDQVYADEVWTAVPELRAFAEASFADGNKMRCPARLVDKLGAFYFDLYVRRWSQPELAAMLAAIPTLMMWDDHDTIDGWGSYPPERQNCPIFKNGLGPNAAKAFKAMQRQQPADQPPIGSLFPNTFSKGHVIGRLAVLAIDMRSERTIGQVLSPGHWGAIYAWLAGLEEIDHLVIMSSIPVIYPGFDTLEALLGAWPGYQNLEDDLRDHWNSPDHKVERLRLIHRLLEFARATNIMPTIVSGDVHVAALGVVESKVDKDAIGNDLTFYQLISSGIVHPGPGATVAFALNELLDSSDEIDTAVHGRMVTFPTSKQKFIASRNFLTIEPDLDRERARLWANWWIENGTKDPLLLTKVVGPLPIRATS